MILSLNCYFRLSYKLRCYTRISSPAKKNYHIFHVRLISQISCRHVTRLRRHPVRLMKEGQSLHHSTQSLIVCNAKTLVLNVSIIPLEASVRPFLQRWLNDWNVFISVPAPSRYVIRYVERELKEKEDTIEANKEQLKLVEEEWEHLNLYPTK